MSHSQPLSPVMYAALLTDMGAERRTPSGSLILSTLARIRALARNVTVLATVVAAGRGARSWAVGALVGKVPDLAATEAAQPGTFGRGRLDLVWCREGRVALEFGRLLLRTLLLQLHGLLDRLL